MNSPENQENNWRDEVMAQSFSGLGRYAYSASFTQAMLRARPDLATVLVFPERQRTLEFIQSYCTEVQWLLANSHHVIIDDEMLPNIGWCEAVWQNERVEIALLAGRNEPAVCLGPDTKILEELAQALEKFADAPSGRCLRYSEGWENAPDLDEEIGKVTWDDLVLPPAILQSVRESVETFFAHKAIIQDFGFAWKRGILLIGPPGTGKTMTCKAAAAALPDLPFLYVRDLRENDQKESIEAIFKRARKLAPCILAMEDLDSLITPENRAMFLNEMDGFQSNDGILIIASTNHPKKIDEALLRRPSRFDRVFHIGLPELAERRTFCEKILNGERLKPRFAPDYDRAALAETIASKTEGFTPAYLKEAFASAALGLAQQGIGILDERFGSAVMAQIAELRAHLKRSKNPDALVEMRSQDDTIGFRR